MNEEDAATAFSAAMDQHAAFMRPVALAVASYSKELRKNGVSRSEANDLTMAYQERLFDHHGFGVRKEAE